MTDGPTSSPDLSPLQQAFLALERAEARVRELEQAAGEPIAIVGLGCRLPGAPDPEALWRVLRNGEDTISEVPADRWDLDELYDPDPTVPGKMSTRHGGFLDSIDQFDPDVFGIAPREAQAMDPQQRLLLEVAWETLERAGVAPMSLQGSRTGVFVGVTTGDYAQLTLNQHGVAGLDAYYASGVSHSIASGRLSYILGLEGPSITLDTACSSSLTAIHLAVQSLRQGESDLALAGGVNMILSPETSITLSKYNMMAPDGRCKFGADTADGFVRAEGCAIVALKRLSDAQADHDRILAVIRGSAIGQDGASSGLTAPNGPSQERVIRDALANGGVDPSQVSYIEAHGTGTSLGDPIEIRALGSVFGSTHSDTKPLVVGSVKTNLGHLEASAGVTGLAKLALMLQHREIPASLHFTAPNPHIPWADLPVEVPTEHRGWQADGDLVAGLSSFGFSGTNVHLVVSEPPEAPTTSASDQPAPRAAHIVAVSGRSQDALQAAATNLAVTLDGPDGPALNAAARTATVGRTHFDHRAAVIATDRAEASEALAALGNGQPADGVLHGHRSRNEQVKVGFLYTGQGAQHAGMGRDLYRSEPVFRQALDRCAATLEPHLDHPLLALMGIEDNPAVDPELINQTAVTQPATVAIEYALTELWRSWGVTPNAVLGHSVGEYAAAVTAGVMPIERCLELIATRGRLMQDLDAGGGMTAVFAPPEDIVEAIQPFGDRIAVAAYNGPAHIVLSGDLAALDELSVVFESSGIKARPLKVSHAFHSSRMDPMLDRFEDTVRSVDMVAPELRLISNVTGGLAGRDITDPGYWRRHARQPVLFHAGMQELAEAGCDIFIEIGPQPTLIGLGQEIIDPGAARWLPSIRRGRDEVTQVYSSLAGAFCHGVDVDWRGFEAPYPTPETVELPTYPFQRERFWIRPGSGPRPRTGGGGHPLLGTRIPSPLPQVQFTGELTADGPDFVRDHRVHDVTILPGTGFIEMALTAGAEVLGGPCSIDTMDLVAALVVDIEPVTVSTVVSPTDGGATFEISSSADDGRSWTTHARGKLTAATNDRSTPDPDRLNSVRNASYSTIIDRSEHRARLTDAGLDFGPSLGGVRELSISPTEGEACAEIGMVADPGPYRFHPAVLDACLQAMAWLVGDTDDVFLPIVIERIQVLAEPTADVVAHARLHERTDDAPASDDRVSRDIVSGDLDVLAEDGSLLASLRGVHFRRIDAAALQAARGIDLAGSLYSVAWEAKPLPDGTTTAPADLPSTEVLLAEAESRIEERAADNDLDRYQQLNDHVEVISTDYAVNALRRLAPGQTFALADLGVIDAHLSLARRLMAGLAEDGRLTANGDRYTIAVDDQPDLDAIGRRLEDLERDHPAAKGQLALVRRCGEHLADALSGRQDPLELLFPGGAADDAEHMYRHSPFAHFYNSLAADAVATATEGATVDRPLRILEVGAGTGGTTSHILDRVDPALIDYTFTDVSPLFVERAKEEFGSRPGMSFAALDIEANVEDQGFTAQAYDVVVATNVLHATADLRRTFSAVKTLLAPGGALVMMEMTKPERFIDITFGLTPGWWKFQDHDLRPDYLLLDTPRWLDFLGGEGFDRPRACPTAATVGQADLTMQSLFVATKPGSEDGGTGRDLGGGSWLILADEGGVGASLAAELDDRGANVVTAGAGPGHQVTVDPADADKVQQLVAGHDRTPWTGVVHLWSLDASEADRPTDQSLTGQRTRTGSALAVTQSLLDGGGAPRLWLVTRGAQPVSGSVADPQQAPLWGLGKVIALEHPELGAVCVDLDPSVSSSPTADLLPELLTDQLASDEAMVAHRRGNRYVARLDPQPDAAATADEPTPLLLHLAEDGSLDGMGLKPIDRVTPGPGQVEIRVHAAGLNFRDVMNALAMRDDQVPAGSECAGVVTAVGDGVDEFDVGDAVIAIAPGCFGSFVVTSTDLVVAKPATLSFAEAATVPLAFLTAHSALHDLADISAGESVLVHAAAGGVGLAAVQLAKRAGATPYGTAGTDTKRGYLETLGVAPAMSSRDTTFADQVRAATSGRGVDVVLNSLVGEFIPATMGVMAPSGRFVELGKREILSPEQLAADHPGIAYHTVPLAEDLEHRPEVVRPVFRELVEAIETGELQPLPLQTFPLTEAADAFRYMAQARHIGKIVLVAEAADAETTPAPLAQADGSTLITGGLRGLGITVAEWLVEQGTRNLALLGRTAPGDETTEAIQRMEAAGATITVIEADVSERDQLSAALATIRTELPPLRAVIHSAGVLDDGAILRQDWKRFSTVMQPKVTGASLLDELTQDLELDHFVLFSSAASLFGSSGQANHAAANAYLDALAAKRRAHGRPGLSINWGAWSEIGAAVDTGAAARNEEVGLRSITPDDGLAALQALTGQGRPQVGVVPIDWSVYGRQFGQAGLPPYLSRAGTKSSVAGRSAERAAPSGPVLDLEQLAADSPEQQDQVLVGFVAEQVARVLGTSDPAKLDPIEPLHDMGLDSLMAVELRNLLGSGLGLEDALPAVVVFNYPTIEALAGYLRNDALGLGRTEPMTVDQSADGDAGSTSSVDDLLAAVEGMSDDELDTLFGDDEPGQADETARNDEGPET